MGFRALSELQPLYVLPYDDLTGQVMIPCLKESITYDCMTGFFHSSAIRELAPGLAQFIARREGQMRLLASPYLSPQDQAAIREGLTSAPEALAQRLQDLCGSSTVTVTALVRHTLECLAWLIAERRIQMKLVVVHEGLFHPKVRLFFDGDNHIAVYGSNNLTQPGFTTNFEQVSVSRSWRAGEHEVMRRLTAEFERIWNLESDKYIRTYEMPKAFAERIVREFLPSQLPTPDSFWDAWMTESQSGLANGPRPRPGGATEIGTRRVFSIPSTLVYETGDFAHQGQAVRSWTESGRRGILEMATGSGKTVTSLIAARMLFDQVKPLLIVIAAPYLPLISQWADEADKFGLDALVPSGAATRVEKLETVRKAVRNLALGVSQVECIIVTHDFLCNALFHKELMRYSGPAMLIADEVHDLGTPSFLQEPPQGFVYRLGLSATPTRQYDEAGNAGLIGFFGEVVFRFTLKEAIGKCLVPYNYYVHLAELTPNELEEWLEATAKLRRMGWTFATDDTGGDARLQTAIRNLLLRRRRILEQAASKLPMLHQLLDDQKRDDIKHTLIYASDKGRSQLNQVNRMLMDDLRLRIHQLTQEETGRGHVAEDILREFANANIQILTAMRVLDEGIDIPEVSTAYILASTTVERQWVQRRGRVLRKCSRTNKKLAHIHDFLVIPPEGIDSDLLGPDVSTILKRELERVMEFAGISTNAAAPGGALATIRPLIGRFF